jgi:hypothetical protein
VELAGYRLPKEGNMKRSLMVLIVLLAAVTAWSQSLWEGNAAIAAYGEFPDGGFYAASDSFERNSVVRIENPSTGETVQVIVVKRLDDPGLFMVISPEAGEEIGLSGTDIAPVRVTRSGRTGSLPGIVDDIPYSVDPDINPAASVADPNDLAFLDNVLATEDYLSTDTEEEAIDPVEPGTEAPEIVTDGVVPDEEVATDEPADLPVDPIDETTDTSETDQPDEETEVADTGDDGSPEVVLDGEVPLETDLPDDTTDEPHETGEPSDETSPEVVLDGEVPVETELPDSATDEPAEAEEGEEPGPEVVLDGEVPVESTLPGFGE